MSSTPDSQPSGGSITFTVGFGDREPEQVVEAVDQLRIWMQESCTYTATVEDVLIAPGKGRRKIIRITINVINDADTQDKGS